MSKCKNCSASLSVNSSICSYCYTRNDMNFHASGFNLSDTLSDRICPHCNDKLETIKMPSIENLFIERCNQCFGLFFDKGELDLILKKSVTNVNEVNFKLIKNINKDWFESKTPVKYIKCPVCNEFMDRHLFAKKSGVVIDTCRHHGIWLENGEITQLMEWKKAGGEILSSKIEKEAKKRVIKEQSKSVSSSTSVWTSRVDSKQEFNSYLSNVVFSVFNKLF